MRYRSGRGYLGLLFVAAMVLPLVAACSRLGVRSSAAPSPTVAAAAASNPSSTSGGTTPASPEATPAAPPTLAPPSPTTAAPTATPSAQALQDVVTQYVNDWQAGRYADMYSLLSASAQASIPQDKFVARYTNIASGIEQTGVTVVASPAGAAPLTPVAAAATPSANGGNGGAPPVGATPAAAAGSPTAAGVTEVQVPFKVTYHLAVLGDITENNVLPLVQQNGAWKVAWTPGLIFKDLTTDRVVRYDPVTPIRGTIYDRNGNVLAEDGTVVTVGVVPGEIKDEAAMLKALSDYLQIPADTIKQAYANAQPDWFVPLKVLPASQRQDAQQKLGNVLGVELRDTQRRVYPYGADAADFVGYVSRVQQADLKSLGPTYSVGDWVGRAGIEAWGEQYLAGQKGATLAILNPDGTVVRTIAQKVSVPGDNLYTTVDINYQIAANKILGIHAGSLIVMNPSDNTVLAISSEPSFDPNLFVLGMTDAQWQAMNAPTHPLMFRPAEGLYPTGSIFKVITMAAGLEKGGFKPADTFDCGLDWHGPGGIILHNWRAEGTLNLIQSLTGSCDPTFYTIGLKLNQIDPNILPSFARAYGLGQSTGISGVSDAPGTVPDPAWKEKTVGQPWYDGDGINLAIGQGYLLATPLQMANVYSTIAAHGVLRTPVLVSAIKAPNGAVVKSFTAQTRSTVPVSPQNLGYIVEGMRGVTSTPLGTAYYAWRDSKIPMEAKTGSAENETSKAHAWFVGYTPPDNPNLLALVMLEGGELGGEYAAPLGLQIVDYAVAHPVKPMAN
jgi:penicillin-binding protein 2